MAYVNVAEWNSDQVAEWLKEDFEEEEEQKRRFQFSLEKAPQKMKTSVTINSTCPAAQAILSLDDVLLPYIHSFISNNVDGHRLLHLAHDDFPTLNITCIGHQEIILQGVELLSNIHYHIHKENLQDIALWLSSKARSIYNELRISDSSNQDRDKFSWDGDYGHEYLNGNDVVQRSQKNERVSTRIVAGVADVLSSVKTLVSWLHRTPFHGQEQYDELKSKFVDISIQLATIAQRDSFAENPVSVIRESCLELAEMADSIIQDSKDPLILQPASLDVFTIKKRADDNWGIGIFSSYHGIHQISAIRALSPAHTCGKLMGGDQVIQVNYQTVVGWMSYKVTQLMQENPTQVILTLKKCPRHVNTITEIYFKPIRLPSKKRTYSPWNSNVMVPQRYDLQSIPNLQFIKSYDGRSAAQRVINTEPHPKSMSPTSGASNSIKATLNSSGSDLGTTTASEGDDEASDFDDDAFISDDVEFGGTSSLSVRLFQPKPRPHVQRRATIPGATARHSLPFEHILHEYCQRQLVVSPLGSTIEPDSYLFRSRDNLENRITRPHTCIGTEKKEVSKEINFPSLKDEGDMPFIDESDEKEDAEDDNPAITLPKSSSKIYLKKENTGNTVAKISNTPSQNTTVDLKKRSMTPPKSPIEAIDELKIFRRISEERPKLDKSYSSPTYDLDDEEASAFLQRKNALISPSKKGKETNTIDNIETSNNKDCCIMNEITDKKEIEDMLENTISNGSFIVKEMTMIEPLYSPNIESNNKDELQHFLEGTSHMSLSSLAIPTLDIMTSVPSMSTNLGGNCGSVVSSNFRNETSDHLINASKPSISHPLSKYVDMNKTVINDALSQFEPNPPSYATHDYINYANGGGLITSGNNDGEGLMNRLAINHQTSLEEEKKITNKLQVQKDDSVISKVVLRDGKSNSPFSWRRGLIGKGSSVNRRISCRDLGQGDHHGWLYRRKDSKGFLISHRWEKRWFILKKSSLYGYRDEDAMKADSLIYLPGFHVCPAPDVKSKRFAFKIYHSSGATFYFACDSGEERSRWMSQMGMSAISSSPSKHQEEEGKIEEAYYSETDDELDKSPSLQRPPYTSASSFSPGREMGFFSIGGKQSSTSPNTRISPLGSLSGVRNPGLKFLQSSKVALSQPLPTSNFRSYVRVRESPSGRSPSASSLLTKEGASPDVVAIDSKGRKQVCRKGSLRERLKQLPASLTLDRRKNSKNNSASETNSNSARRVVGSKSETSLTEKHTLQKELQSKPNSQIPGYMRHTHSSTFSTPTRPTAEMELFPQNKFRRVSPTPSNKIKFSCNPVDSQRRGSVSGISNASLRSISPRRGSLDCLVMKGASPPTTPVKGGDSGLGSTGSLSANDYVEGSPEKLWIKSLRSNAPKSRSGVCIKVPLGNDSISADRLKQAVNYHPPILRNKPDTMKTAFEMNLNTSEYSCSENNVMQSQYGYVSSFASSDTAHLRNIITPQESPNHRPKVPPRTKFLSPSERHLSILSPSSLTSPNTSASTSEIVSRVKSKAPPNLTLSPTSEDNEAPRTPLKPTMGVAMIGKQRRTPGILSPREVFVFSSPNSPYNSPSPSCVPHPRSLSSSHILANKVDQVLPHYPGMEYPPTFEPESYSLSLAHDDRPLSTTPRPALPPKPQKGEKSSVSSSTTSLSLSTKQNSSGYVNISHVSNTLAEFQARSYHHSIYVTSPCSGGISLSTASVSTQLTPQRRFEGNDNSEMPLDEYVPMGQVTSSSRYNNSASLCGTRIWEEREDNLSQGD